jgi:hypothetical protein
MQNRMPDGMSEYIYMCQKEYMPERMPGRMSEYLRIYLYMPERMPGGMS